MSAVIYVPGGIFLGCWEPKIELEKESLSFGDPNLNKLDSYTVEITSRMGAARFRREI